MVQSIAEVRRRAAGRIPPHNLEAEESLLGAMLLSRDAIALAAEARVEVGDFYKPAHGHIFEAVMSLYGQGEPVDPVTVSEELRRAELLDTLGGKPTLLRLQAETPASANAAHYASIVTELALLRRLIGVAGEIAESAYDAPSDVTETLDRAESMVFEVAERRIADSVTDLYGALQSAMDQLEAIYGRDVEVIGLPTGYVDLDHMLLGMQPQNLIVVAARPSMGKCIAWDTPVIESRTGALLTAAEFHLRGRRGEGVAVQSLGPDLRLRDVTPSAFVDDGLKPVYRVRTRLGRELRTTASHPFLTLQGWLPLHELSVGARIAVPRRLPVFGNERMTRDEVVLLAYLIGDGCLVKTSAEFTNTSPSIVEDMKIAAAGMGVNVRECRPHTFRLSTPRGRPNPLIELLRRLELFGEGSYTKFVPDPVFRLPKDQIALFLNRLYATDGWASVGRSGCQQIGYGSMSKRLTTQLQHLLLRFGVIAGVEERRVKYNGAYRKTWQLVITHQESIEVFASEIGIFSKERAVDRVVAASRSCRRFSVRDTLPIEVWRIVLDAKGDESWADVSSRAGKPRNHNWHVGTRGIGRGTAAALATALNSDELQRLLDSDVYWDEITSIEPAGVTQVYDLTVPGDHNFVAADCLVHNTAFALSAATHVANVERKPVLLFSMEMGQLEITKRVLSAEARVPARKLQLGNISEDEWDRISRAMTRLGEAPLFIDDNPHCTIMEMRAKARRIKARQGELGLIVVDYLQLMSTSNNAESRQVEVSELSRGLKLLARELECPVMALSQLNRQLEYRSDKRPMLADLRESGSVEQDADVVVFIYRDEVYNPEDQENRGKAEIIVGKHRNGPTGSVELAFHPERAQFTNMALD